MIFFLSSTYCNVLLWRLRIPFRLSKFLIRFVLKVSALHQKMPNIAIFQWINKIIWKNYIVTEPIKTIFAPNKMLRRQKSRILVFTYSGLISRICLIYVVLRYFL